MQANFINIDAYRFSLNGQDFYKIFHVIIKGDLIKVVNVYDTRYALLNYTNYADVQVDGATYNSALELANALNSVVYTREVNGNSGAYNGVSADSGNPLTNGTDGGPFLDPTLFPSAQEVTDGDAQTLEEAKAYAETIGGGQFAEPTRIVRYVEGYDSGLTYIPFVEWLFDGESFSFSDTPLTLSDTTVIPAGEKRIDRLVADSSGSVYFKTGSPAVNPSPPELDLNTELEVTFILVSSGATQPDAVNLTKVYGENAGTAGGEFDIFEKTLGARINLESLADKYAGNISIEGTDLLKGDYIDFLPENPITKNDYSRLKFRIKNKPGSYPDGAFRISLYGTNATGGSNYIALEVPEAYGFDRDNTTDWQLVSLPIPTYDTITEINAIRFRNAAKNNDAYGFFLDEVYLVAGSDESQTDPGFATLQQVQDGDAATLDSAKTYADQEDATTLQAAKDYTDQVAGENSGTSVKKRYLTVAEMTGDQLAQIDKGVYYVADASADSTVDAGFAYYEYLGTTTGDLTDYRKLSEEESIDVETTAPVIVSADANNALTVGTDGGAYYNPPPASGSAIAARYNTFADLLADQANQADKELFYVADASGHSTVDAGSAYFEYLGTTNGTEADYRKLSEEESMDASDGSVDTTNLAKLDQQNKFRALNLFDAVKLARDSASNDSRDYGIEFLVSTGAGSYYDIIAHTGNNSGTGWSTEMRFKVRTTPGGGTAEVLRLAAGVINLYKSAVFHQKPTFNTDIGTKYITLSRNATGKIFDFPDYENQFGEITQIIGTDAEIHFKWGASGTAGRDARFCFFVQDNNSNVYTKALTIEKNVAETVVIIHEKLRVSDKVDLTNLPEATDDADASAKGVAVGYAYVNSATGAVHKRLT